MANYDAGGTNWGEGLDWDITSNQGLTPLVNYNFNLQVEGVYNLPCKSVRVFQRENEYETLQEGGLNDYVHMLRKPISKPLTFQVERYVGIDMFDPLALGTDLILPVLLMVSRYQGEGDNGVLDLSDSMQRVYTFTGCTVISKEFGELNAERSGLLVETTTIAYREMLCVDNPSTKSKRKTWSMKKDHDKMERDTERKSEVYTRYGINERTKDELETRAKMYVDKKVKDVPMHVYDYKGTKVQKIKISDDRGIAKTNEMEALEDRERAATRYFMPGGKSLAKYKGASKKHAVVNKDELSKKEMEALAKTGGAKIPTMKPTEGQRKFFIKGSTSAKDYKGTVKQSATLVEGEKRKEALEAEAREGGAKKMEMKPTEGQRRYFMEGSTSAKDYKGTVKQSAALVEGEKRKEALEAKAREGGAKKMEMQPTKGQRIFFIEGSTSEKNAMNAQNPTNAEGAATAEGTTSAEGTGYTMKRSAALVKGEKSKKELEAATRKGGANKYEMKPTEGQRRYFMEGSTSVKDYKGTVKPSAALVDGEKRKKELEANARKGGANIPKMKPTQAREGGAVTKEMRPAENQRKYVLPGSEGQASYGGIARPSATINSKELHKPAMQAKARKWPPNRSAADVAAFLKKK
ncbi:MAG: hypothetical protein PUD20_08630 [bacterium]|nr:hypothetical protein [bacterium]